nr:PilW family protein [Variovorax terrae]
MFSQATRQAGLQDTYQYAQLQTGLAPSYNWDVARFTPVPPSLLGHRALFGYNNAKAVASPSAGTDYSADDNSGTTNNNSDVFGVRYFGSSRQTDITTGDGSVINCQGTPVPYPLTASDIGLSLFTVGTGSTGEPELQCIVQGNPQVRPLVGGVETLQIVYAVDTDTGATADNSPNRWLNAAQVSTAALWPKVRMIRVGMVLRGAPGSAETQATALYPLGEEFSKISGSPSTETGMVFTPPNDGRLRRAFAFNIAVRNNLE